MTSRGRKSSHRQPAQLGYQGPAGEDNVDTVNKDAKKTIKSTEKKKKTLSTLFESAPKNFRIGGDRLPKNRDLTRYVKWPLNVRLQRQRRVLLRRLKVPPAIHQFSTTLDKSQAAQLIRLLAKYKPETRIEKKQRLLHTAKAITKKEDVATKKPINIKYGINHVTDLVEIKKAKLVVIAHDVDPIELVLWLPALCRRKDIPYCIVKSKSRLGKLIHKKNVSVLALDNVRREDQASLATFVQMCRTLYNENADHRKRWGGGHLGRKSFHKKQKKFAGRS